MHAWMFFCPNTIYRYVSRWKKAIEKTCLENWEKIAAVMIFPMILARVRLNELNLFRMLLNSSLQFTGIRSNHTINFFAILDQNKCWHGCNLVLFRNGFTGVDVHLQKDRFILEVTSTPRFDLGTYTLTRTTPSKQDSDIQGKLECVSTYVAKKSITYNLPLLSSFFNSFSSSSNFVKARTIASLEMNKSACRRVSRCVS